MTIRKFTAEDISKSLGLLEKKITKISFLVEMLDRYFQPGQFLVTNKTIGLSMMFSALEFHIYGQLGRYCFDRSHKSYLTASILEIYNQIEGYTDQGVSKDSVHREEFEKVKTDLKLLESKFKRKFSTFSDKYYAHIEIRALEQEESQMDGENTQEEWCDIISIVNQSKEILNKMLMFWFNRVGNFESRYYSNVASNFWKLFDLPEDASDPSDSRWHIWEKEWFPHEKLHRLYNVLRGGTK